MARKLLILASREPIPDRLLARYETEGGAKQAEGRPERAKRLKRIERSQVLLRAIDVEKLVEEDHVVRGIWAMVKRLDMRRLEEGIKAVEGGGRSEQLRSADVDVAVDIRL